MRNDAPVVNVGSPPQALVKVLLRLAQRPIDEAGLNCELLLAGHQRLQPIISNSHG